MDWKNRDTEARLAARTRQSVAAGRRGTRICMLDSGRCAPMTTSTQTLLIGRSLSFFSAGPFAIRIFVSDCTIDSDRAIFSAPVICKKPLQHLSTTQHPVEAQL